MGKYWLVFKSSLQDVLQYRFNFLMHVFKYVFAVTMMALIWLAVLHEKSISGLTPQSIVQYFFFAAILYSLSNFHTWYVENDIKQGELSKYLLKPFSSFQYYFSYQTGQALIDTLVKAVVMIPMLYIFGLPFSAEIQRVTLFILFIPAIFYFTFCVQFMMASLAFWIQEVYSIRFVSLSITRFLSGIIIPLQLFPGNVQRLLFFTPFPHLAYIPITLIQGTTSVTTALQGLGILLSWAILAQVCQIAVWHKGTHSYESVGI